MIFRNLFGKFRNICQTVEEFQGHQLRNRKNYRTERRKSEIKHE